MNENKESWKNWSAGQWKTWINENLENRKKVILAEPDELTSSYNRERSSEKDYHGRELLELIQNADDAGINYGKPNRALIKLTDYGLFIANEGIPFSPEGVKSLMISDSSPKQFSKTKCIGYKGLGFRSILGWASSILILSGKLEIGFSEKKAEDWLSNLRKENKSIDSNINVKKFKENGIENPIATLSVPYYISKENLKHEEKLNLMYEKGKEIMEEGYDTVICLLFREPEEIKDQVQKQINSLRKETLLFLQYIKEIEIQSQLKKRVWKVERKENNILINDSEGEECKWVIFSEEGEIDKKYLKLGQTLNRYEIKIAVPEKGRSIGKLFVFFPTEVRFPFPVIAHATFEVSGNRQNIIKSEINDFISKKLALLMASTAEKIRDPKNPWKSLSIVSNDAELDPVLEETSFSLVLNEAIKEKEIIPVRNKGFLTSTEAKRIKGNFDLLLNQEEFNDLCIFCEDVSINRKMNEMEVNFISTYELTSRLNIITEKLELKKRTEIIFLLLENNLINRENPPEILVDEKEQVIELGKGDKVFLPPEGRAFNLPDWTSQKILNTHIVNLLKNKFNISKIRDLRIKLEIFGAQEYNLRTLIYAVSAETNRRCKEEPKKEISFRKEMIQAIFKIYLESEERPNLEEKKIIIPTRKWDSNYAENLYLGREYPGGRILEELYGPVDKNMFVANNSQLGLNGDLNEIQNFLCYLGVNKIPKEIEANMGYRKVKSIDRVEQILSKSDSHSIICWLCNEPRLENWRQENNHIFNILKGSPWLKVIGGKLSPDKCCWATGAKNFSPIIGFPDINMSDPLIKELHIDKIIIKSTLMKIGTLPDLDDLPWDTFYEILVEIPKKDPEGKIAKSIYDSLCRREGKNLSPEGNKYLEFKSNGLMLGKINQKIKYFPIKELFYLDNLTLPKKILEEFPILELSKRKGANKVKDLFCIDQLDFEKINVDIINIEKHPCLENFINEVERLKPYIYALRVKEDTKRTSLNSIKKLKISLCKSLSISMLINQEVKEIKLEEGDYVFKEDCFYLVSNNINHNAAYILKDEIISDSLGEIVANISKVDIQNEVARIATCSINKRNQLLDKLTGGTGEVRMTEVNEIFGESFIEEESFIDSEMLKDINKITPEKVIEKDLEKEINNSQPPIENIELEKSEVGPVEIKSSEQITPYIKRVIVKKLQGNPQMGDIQKKRRVNNPDRAENIAIRYEEANNRYPLKISEIRGASSLGCDIISFSSEKDRENFKTRGNTKLISRYIEVKGSTSEKGSITLEGNELKCARENKTKYFFYRIYEEKDIFCLAELSDPLNCDSNIVEPSYKINIFCTSKTQMYELKELLQDK